MIDGQLPLYFSAVINPRTMPPFLLDYLPDTPVVATVKSAIGAGRYLLEIMGHEFEAVIPIDLEQGTKLKARIRDVSGKSLSLDIPIPREKAVSNEANGNVWERDIDTLLTKMDLPRNDLTRKAAASLLKWDAPVNKESMGLILSAARPAKTPIGQSIEAAAYLLSGGITPTSPDVETVATVALQRPENVYPIALPVETDSADEHLEALPLIAMERNASSPEPPPTADKPILRLEWQIAEILKQSPPLLVLDKLASLTGELLASGKTVEAVENAIQPSVNALLKDISTLISGNLPEKDIPSKIEELKSAIKGLPLSDLRRLHSELERAEQDRLKTTPGLALLKSAKGPAIEFYERQSVFHLLNNISAIKGDPLSIVHIPIVVDNVERYIPVRISWRGGGKGQKREKSNISVSVDIVMSRIGRVRTTMKSFQRNMSVDYYVRDDDVLRIFGKHRSELKDALGAIGFSANIDVLTGKPPTDDPPSLLDHFSREGERYTAVDIKI